MWLVNRSQQWIHQDSSIIHQWVSETENQSIPIWSIKGYVAVDFFDPSRLGTNLYDHNPKNTLTKMKILATLSNPNEIWPAFGPELIP